MKYKLQRLKTWSPNKLALNESSTYFSSILQVEIGRNTKRYENLLSALSPNIIDGNQKNKLREAFDDEKNYVDTLLSMFYDENEDDVESFLDVLMKNSCMRPLVYWIKEIRDKAYKLSLYDVNTGSFKQKQVLQPYTVCKNIITLTFHGRI